ncbi:MAG TPA: tetratricopeptide repeat protein [Prolixibacteraceae bacterium]|nr:tetratricopeptide repeat protein [Prolixibacteraceae bacterium]
MKQKTVLLLLFILPVHLFAQSIDELIMNKNYPKALEAISSKIQEKPEAELFFKQAIIFKEQSKPLQASKSLEQALFYDPASSLYLTELGEDYSSLGNLYQAAECFKRAVLLAPDDLSLKGKLGRTYISLDDFEQAYQTFEAIHKVDSVNVYFKKQFAFAAFKMGKTDLAVRLFEQVVLANPGDFGSHLNLIAIYKRMKDAEKVYEAGNHALSIFPSNATLLLRQADALFELKDYERALYPYEKYLAENDSTFEVLKNYGISLFFCKNEEKAIYMLDKCMRLSLNDQYVYFYLGLAYKNLSRLESSAECLIAAIACSQPPYLSEMYHHLGQVYGSNREFEKSIEALKKAFELNNEKVEVLFEIATTYEEFNFNKTLALNYYSTYLKTAREKAKNADYALGRIRKIKEELFFDTK